MIILSGFSQHTGDAYAQKINFKEVLDSYSGCLRQIIK
jgi:hypothetical protein